VVWETKIVSNTLYELSIWLSYTYTNTQVLLKPDDCGKALPQSGHT